jgi:protein tyrosine phosphatase (PTP) superfamily phosphohydrolase (DUF442 family)
MFLKAFRAVCLTTLLAVGVASAGPATRADDKSVASSTTSTTPGSAATATASPASAGKVPKWDAMQYPSHRRVEQGLPNFGELNANVWRSGQPTKRGFEHLTQMHVKTIVNLRREFPQEKDLVPQGVNYVQIPITDETAPTVEQAKQFMQIVTNPDNWPVLVHCAGGEGRTGALCALVRYSIDGWDKDLVMKEVGNFRIAHLGFFKTRMCGSQRQFLLQWEDANKPGAYLASISSQPTPQP